MWQQIVVIFWAQFRITRNHLPRTSAGSIVLSLLSLLWYGLYIGLAGIAAVRLSTLPISDLRNLVPIGLLGVFLFWQIFPLFTLSSGWSLQLNKIRAYPVRGSALFGIELLLRLTSAPEMIIVLGGAFAGLIRHPLIPLWAPFLLLLYIPFNLLLQLAVRDMVLFAFQRNRFRELFAVVVICLAILPQFLIRTPVGHRMQPYLFAAAKGSITPWHAVSSLSLGFLSTLDILVVAIWIWAAYQFARWQFQRGLRAEDGLRPASTDTRRSRAGKPLPTRLIEWPGQFFRDPLGALLQKELQSLLRMPRFRVLFGMACVFSVLVFFPLNLHSSPDGPGFLRNNFLPIVNLYGLLLLSDVLLLNIFGLDRQAAQIYFVVPIPLRVAVRAKNAVAVIFIAMQTGAVLLMATVFRVYVSTLGIATGIAASAVVTVYLIAVGNFTSVTMARPIDPAQTFRKQAGGKMQLWLLACGVGMYALVGFAFLAQWALRSDAALLGILLLEFVIGLIVYKIATDSAIEHGMRDREQLVETLSRGVSPISAS